jgi:integrase
MVKHLELITKARSEGDPVMYYPKEDLRNKYLFPNCRYGETRRGKRGLRPCKLLHIKEVRKIWKQIKIAAGVEDRDLKSLRHTFAVFCVGQGISLRVLQKYLGHKRIETTMIYAAASDDFVSTESDKVAAGYAA